MGNLRLYHVRYEGSDMWVEAESFGTAILLWREFVMAFVEAANEG